MDSFSFSDVKFTAFTVTSSYSMFKEFCYVVFILIYVNGPRLSISVRNISFDSRKSKRPKQYQAITLSQDYQLLFSEVQFQNIDCFLSV